MDKTVQAAAKAADDEAEEEDGDEELEESQLQASLSPSPDPGLDFLSSFYLPPLNLAGGRRSSIEWIQTKTAKFPKTSMSFGPKWPIQ